MIKKHTTNKEINAVSQKSILFASEPEKHNQ